MVPTSEGPSRKRSEWDTQPTLDGSILASLLLLKTCNSLLCFVCFRCPWCLSRLPCVLKWLMATSGIAHVSILFCFWVKFSAETGWSIPWKLVILHSLFCLLASWRTFLVSLGMEAMEGFYPRLFHNKKEGDHSNCSCQLASDVTMQTKFSFTLLDFYKHDLGNGSCNQWIQHS